MRRVSKKTAARLREAKPIRNQLLVEVGKCEICGHDPRKVAPGDVRWALHVHEIARGPHRLKAIDKPFAVLVVCFVCHEYRLSSREKWPEARQLAMLLRSRPSHYDLEAFNALVGRGPDRVTEEEVARFAQQTRPASRAGKRAGRSKSS